MLLIKIIKRESRKLRRAFLHPTFLFLLLLGNTSLFISVFLVYHFENHHNPNMDTLFDALWWGVSTITTVGYGDAIPVSFGGRMVGIFLMFTGTILFIAFTGVLVTRWMEDEVDREEKGREKLEKSIKEIKERLDQIQNEPSED